MSPCGRTASEGRFLSRPVCIRMVPVIPIDAVEEMVAGIDCDIVFCGHTHIPCGFQLNSGKTLVNVGSVGRPMTQEKNAVYALMDIDPDTLIYSVEFVSVKYDYNKSADKIRKRGLEGADTLAKLVEG